LSFAASANWLGASAAATGIFGYLAARGTLELSEWQNRVWVKVHPLHGGGWTARLAHELSEQQSESG
jgi:hypothetical protein